MYEHWKIGLPLLSHQYTNCGDIIEGIPQIIPADGWYWVQIGKSQQVQWAMCCINGDAVLMMDAIYHWDEIEFHRRHTIGPAVAYPKRDDSPEMVAVTAMNYLVNEHLNDVEEDQDEGDNDA